MKIKVTSISKSKKGKTWIQCEVVDGLIGPDLDGIYDCKYDQESTRRGTYTKKKKEEKKSICPECQDNPYYTSQRDDGSPNECRTCGGKES